MNEHFAYPQTATAISTPSGQSFQLPVGPGITPAIWMKMSKEVKIGVAFGFGFSCVETFERNVLDIGYTVDASTTMANTQLPDTESDAEIAVVLQRELARGDDLK